MIKTTNLSVISQYIVADFRVQQVKRSSPFLTIPTQKNMKIIFSFSSQDLKKAMPIFVQNHPKIIKVTFLNCITMHKNNSAHQFILELQQILQFQDLKGHAPF